MNGPIITSRQNQRVKTAVELRQHKWRVVRQQILIDGVREIIRAIHAGIECTEAFVCEELCNSEQSTRAVELLAAGGTEILRVSPTVFAKLTYGDRAEGVVAAAQMPCWTITKLPIPAEPFIAVVDHVEKPGNLGAIIRTADAAGVDAVISADGKTDLFNPNTIRASLGTVFRDNVCCASAEVTLQLLNEHGVRILTATPEAESQIFDVSLRGAVAIVLGSEADGLSPLWRRAAMQRVRLPMNGMGDSLNVSATAAVVFYEALRQRSEC